MLYGSRVPPLRSCACLSLPLALGACSAPPVEPDPGSRHAVGQVPAFVEAVAPGPGDPGGRATPADLVAGLDDPDPAVRLFAIGGLQRLTDRRFGYRWYRDRAGRRDAVDAWEAWAEGLEPGR